MASMAASMLRSGLMSIGARVRMVSVTKPGIEAVQNAIDMFQQTARAVRFSDRKSEDRYENFYKQSYA